MAQTQVMPQQAQQVSGQIQRPNKPQWNCHIDTPPKDPAGFTVGEVFEIACEGAPLALKPPLKVELPETLHHVIVLLKPVSATDGKVVYQATSYRAGSVKMPFLNFTDAGGAGFISQPMEIKTMSVIDPKNPPKSPYGQMAPLTMNYPTWLPFAGAVFAAVLVAWVLVFLRRRLQRKSLEKNIKKFQSPLGSYHQFSKDIRLLKRGVVFSTHVAWSEAQRKEYLLKLDEAFRMFILREYIVPADRWTTNMTLKHIHRKDRVHYERYEAVLVKALRELDRAKEQFETLFAKDIEQLTSICTQAVEQMWKSKLARAR